MRRTFGPRFEDGLQHARVSQAHTYDVVTTLWRRRVGNGTLECKMLRAKAPAKRIVQLHAQYTDAGVLTTAVVQVHSPEDEARQALRLEGEMRAASARPEGSMHGAIWTPNSDA